MNLTPERIQESFGICITNEQIDKILHHTYKVMQKNEYINLTRITDIDDAIEYHIMDSLSAVPFISECLKGEYLDLGTGGGYPGIPLAIATGRKGVLLDATKKKIVAVQEFIDELGIQNQIETVSERAEEYALERPEYFTAVVVRAVAKTPVLLELASPLLCKGGRLIVMKGDPQEDELRDAKRVSSIVGMIQIEESRFTLGPEEKKRTILVYEKIKKPKIRLPRNTGMAQHHPL